jgi:hypothetical protein
LPVKKKKKKKSIILYIINIKAKENEVMVLTLRVMLQEKLCSESTKNQSFQQMLLMGNWIGARFGMKFLPIVPTRTNSVAKMMKTV